MAPTADFVPQKQKGAPQYSGAPFVLPGLALNRTELIVSLPVGMALVLVVDSQACNGLADLMHMRPIDVAFLLIWGAILGAPVYGAWRIAGRFASKV